MDLTIDFSNYKLNVRAGVIIIHDNKLLVHKNAHDDYYAVVGGRVQTGEDSAHTLKREILEEMGKKIEIIEYVATIENFFKGEDKIYHEIMFVYKAEFEDEEDKKITTTIQNIEGEDLSYEWIDLDKLDNEPLRPNIMKKILKENKFPVHEINKMEE